MAVLLFPDVILLSYYVRLEQGGTLNEYLNNLRSIKIWSLKKGNVFFSFHSIFLNPYVPTMEPTCPFVWKLLVTWVLVPIPLVFRYSQFLGGCIFWIFLPWSRKEIRFLPLPLVFQLFLIVDEIVVVDTTVTPRRWTNLKKSHTFDSYTCNSLVSERLKLHKISWIFRSCIQDATDLSFVP
jgi:hypothetical protein